MGFSRQGYCSGLLFPPPGDLPNPEIQNASPALVGRLLTTPTWQAPYARGPSPILKLPENTPWIHPHLFKRVIDILAHMEKKYAPYCPNVFSVHTSPQFHQGPVGGDLTKPGFEKDWIFCVLRSTRLSVPSKYETPFSLVSWPPVKNTAAWLFKTQLDQLSIFSIGSTTCKFYDFFFLSCLSKFPYL